MRKTARLGNKDSKEELEVLDIIFYKMNKGELIYDIPLDTNQKNIFMYFPF